MIVQQFFEPDRYYAAASHRAGEKTLESSFASQIENITTFNNRDFKGIEKFGIKIMSPKKL